jgi:hypothetical protein
MKKEKVNVSAIMTEKDVPTGVASIMVGNDDGLLNEHLRLIKP